MAKYRNQLPQLSGRLFLTDGGMETTLIFHDGIELPYFASFDLMQTPKTARARCAPTMERYTGIARSAGIGFVLESPTWRANPGLGGKARLFARGAGAVNRRSIELMAELRRELETPANADGHLRQYRPARRRLPSRERDDARRRPQDYHGEQIAMFADSEADMVSAFTINYVEEAIGVARAAKAARHAGGDLVHARDRRASCRAARALKDAIEQVRLRRPATRRPIT